MYVTAYGSSPSVWSNSSLGCGSSAPAIRICARAQPDLAERHPVEHRRGVAGARVDRACPRRGRPRP